MRACASSAPLAGLCSWRHAASGRACPNVAGLTTTKAAGGKKLYSFEFRGLWAAAGVPAGFQSLLDQLTAVLGRHCCSLAQQFCSTPSPDALQSLLCGQRESAELRCACRRLRRAAASGGRPTARTSGCCATLTARSGASATRCHPPRRLPLRISRMAAGQPLAGSHGSSTGAAQHAPPPRLGGPPRRRGRRQPRLLPLHGRPPPPTSCRSRHQQRCVGEEQGGAVRAAAAALCPAAPRCCALNFERHFPPQPGRPQRGQLSSLPHVLWFSNPLGCAFCSRMPQAARPLLCAHSPGAVLTCAA
jgi:hypothetical protein